MKTKSLRLKNVVMGLVATATVLLGGWNVQAEENPIHICAETPTELVTRGVEFTIKTEVQSKKLHEDSVEVNKAQFEDLLCFHQYAVDYSAEAPTTSPAVKDLLKSVIKQKLQARGISISSDKTLAARFVSDEAVVNHIANFTVDTAESYLAFWYTEFYPEESNEDSN